jgi:urease accessory protein
MQAAAVRLAAKGLNPDEIDHALDIRMPSKAARAASRAQGRGLIRVADQVWPEISFEVTDHHHPVAFGVIANSFGASDLAPLAFLQQSLMSGASAGVRLMGFDPISVTYLISQMRSIIEEVSQSIAQIEGIDEIPAGSLPGLESLTENYPKAQVRLFAS